MLVVLDRPDELARKSFRNIPRVNLLPPDQLNTYDVLLSDRMVFTETSLASINEHGQRDEPDNEHGQLDKHDRPDDEHGQRDEPDEHDQPDDQREDDQREDED